MTKLEPDQHGIETWGNTKQKYLRRVNVLNKRALRIVFNLPPLESTKDIMLSNKIFSVKKIYLFSILKLGFEIQNSLAPQGILHIFESESLSSRRHMNFRIRKARPINNALKALPTFTIPYNWNKLNETWKEDSHLKTFKHRLKIYLLNDDRN